MTDELFPPSKYFTYAALSTLLFIPLYPIDNRHGLFFYERPELGIIVAILILIMAALGVRSVIKSKEKMMPVLLLTYFIFLLYLVISTIIRGRSAFGLFGNEVLAFSPLVYVVPYIFAQLYRRFNDHVIKVSLIIELLVIAISITSMFTWANLWAGIVIALAMVTSTLAFSTIGLVLSITSYKKTKENKAYIVIHTLLLLIALAYSAAIVLHG